MIDPEFSRDNAIVFGGSITGLLVANTLAKEFSRVSAIERDVFQEGLAPRLRFTSAQEQSTQTTFLPHFWLASVGFLDVQSMHTRL
jgi:hypothetical protein